MRYIYILKSTKLPVSKKCPYSEFFWSVFSRIRTEYGERRENKDQENSEYEHFLRSVPCKR